MKHPNREQILGTLRHLLTFAGGYLTANSKLSPDDINTITGVVMMLAGWWFSYAAPEKKEELPKNEKDPAPPTP